MTIDDSAEITLIQEKCWDTGCSLPRRIFSSVLLEFTNNWAAAVQAMLELEGGAIANPTEGRQVGHYWLRNPDLSSTAQSKEITDSWSLLEDLANVVAKGDYTDLLMVGIGGSALGPQFLVDALPTHGLKVSFIDNTDPAGMDRVLGSLDLSRTLVVYSLSLVERKRHEMQCLKCNKHIEFKMLILLLERLLSPSRVPNCSIWRLKTLGWEYCPYGTGWVVELRLREWLDCFHSL